jgi:protein TonB
MRSHTDERRFGYAVAASIVVHAIALYGGMPLLRESLQEPVPPPPFVTRLVELPRPAEPAPPPPEVRKPEPRRKPRKPEVAKPLPTPSPIAEPAHEPAPPEPPQPAPPTAAPPVLPQASSPAPTTAPAQPQSDARAAEAATAAQYRLQLIQYAQRNKPPYPAAARENNWAGDVVLDILIRADGRAELTVRRASGYAVLDKLALDTYQQALRAVPVPAALQGRQVKLDPLRVIYNLTEN